MSEGQAHRPPPVRPERPGPGQIASRTLSPGRLRMIARALSKISEEELAQLNDLITAEGGRPLESISPRKRQAAKPSSAQGEPLTE
jgi:hypothetical protein